MVSLYGRQGNDGNANTRYGKSSGIFRRVAHDINIDEWIYVLLRLEKKLMTRSYPLYTVCTKIPHLFLVSVAHDLDVPSETTTRHHPWSICDI